MGWQSLGLYSVPGIPWPLGIVRRKNGERDKNTAAFWSAAFLSINGLFYLQSFVSLNTLGNHIQAVLPEFGGTQINVKTGSQIFCGTIPGGGQ